MVNNIRIYYNTGMLFIISNDDRSEGFKEALSRRMTP